MVKIISRIVLEILGRPPEHIKNSLSMLIEKLGKEKGVKIQESKTNEPIAVPDSKELYTSFAEVMIECDSLDIFMGIIFGYMPANVDVISPENMDLKNADVALFANRLVARLHEYDALTKGVLRERDFLITKLKEFAPHLFKDFQANKKEAKEDKPKEQKPKKEKKPKKNK